MASIFSVMDSKGPNISAQGRNIKNVSDGLHLTDLKIVEVKI